ncbi:hypothetical protein [Flavobacterium sp. NRK1]|uniref:hypothetical protein n=1 Tax=Flavobacterium sp. NRK1 TaxID=2954929 RepID=UPI0020922590|nr:hypothetical protein [Flavobacterium sp. NRK1]MCO6149645.1 hypothetical protein [Flavobacterium sp. NRK1]
MNLLKLAIAAFSATNLMTTFSYLLSASYKKLFKEPVMMNFILEGIGINLKGKLHKIGGWIAHYVIGFFLVIVYESIWRYTPVRFGMLSGLIFGICTGLFGIFCWRAIYSTSIHEDVSPKSYYIQLFFGHIIFAIAVVIAFRIFNYNPISKINSYL